MSKYDNVVLEVKIEKQKSVTVLGKIVTLPYWVTHVAVDRTGSTFYFEDKPEAVYSWLAEGFLDRYGYLGEVEMKPEYNWREMIWEV